MAGGRRLTEAGRSRLLAVDTGSVHGSCRWAGCHLPVLWLAHVRTGRVAAIDRDPTDDGSVRVLLDDDGKPNGLYVVVPRATRSAFVGTLHTPHIAGCGNGTARRLSRERARDRRQVEDDTDGDDVTRAVPCADPACPYPLPAIDLVAGERFHATCDPRYRDRRPRPDLACPPADREDPPR